MYTYEFNKGPVKKKWEKPNFFISPLSKKVPMLAIYTEFKNDK